MIIPDISEIQNITFIVEEDAGSGALTSFLFAEA